MKNISSFQGVGIGLSLLASLFVAIWGIGSEDGKIVLYAIWLLLFGISQLLLIFASKYLEE